MTTDLGLFAGYRGLAGTFDEILTDEGPRPEFARVVDLLARMSAEDLARHQQLAERALLNQGVTFSVYADQRGTEKIFPFCLLPRLVSPSASRIRSTPEMCRRTPPGGRRPRSVGR